MNFNLCFIFVLLFCVNAVSQKARGQLENVSFLVAEQPVRDAVYDTTRNLIYGSVPFRSDSTYANSIVSIDPATGEVVDSIFVGDDPNQLAISSDNSRVYIGVDRGNAFRWWQPGDGQLGELIELRTNRFDNLTTAEDIAVQPGNSGFVVVSKSGGTSYDKLEVFSDNGSLQYQANRRSNSIAFADPFTLITTNNQSSGFGMQRLSLSGLQLSFEQSTHSGGGFHTEIEVGRDNRIYNDDGRVFNVSTFEEQGNLSASVPYDQSTSLVEAVPELGMVYAITADSARPVFGSADVRLVVFNSRTLDEIDSIIVDEVAMEASKGGNLFVAGRDRLAFTSSSESFAFERDLTIISGVSVVLPQPFPLGDVNLSGRVNFSDVFPFIDVLMSGTYFQKADINEDDSNDFLDIGPFISLLR